MTDDTPDLTLLGRRIEKIESDLRWTREAVEDMAASLGRRLTAIEASQRALEDRVTTRAGDQQKTSRSVLPV